ncbi:MAG: hypothetical protein WC783_02710 [Candidatus Paceibacterota bacterium]|jgi:hypothetical protein
MTTKAVTKEYIISYTENKCNGDCEALTSLYCGGFNEESVPFCVLYDIGLPKEKNNDIFRCNDCKEKNI